MRKLCQFLLLFAALRGLELRGQSGFVKSGDQPLPGSSITITQGTQTFSTVTDQDGHYTFPPLAAGAWSVSIAMFGFDAVKKDVDYSAAAGPVNFDLQLKESAALQRMRARQGAAANGASPGRGADAAAANNGAGNSAGENGRRAGNGAGGQNARNGQNGQAIDQDLQNELNAQQNAPAPPSQGNESSNESFLVSGSLSPGVTQGAAADSGPDLRPGGIGGPGGLGVDAANGSNPSVFGGQGQAGGGGGFGGGGFGGGGFGGGGGRGGFSGPGGRNGGRRGQVAGAAFGNRRRPNQQIHGQASFTLQNSAVNAQPFSINGLDIPQAAYAQSRFSLIVGGPLVIPKLVKDPKTQFFVTYFGTRARSPQLFTETVPTAAERNGDFSAALQSLGSSSAPVPVNINNPTTHQPYAGNIIPTASLNPIALGLLSFYPKPNQTGVISNNFQSETTAASNTDNLGIRVQRSVTAKDRVSVNFQYQRRDSTTAQPFGYADELNGYGTTLTLGWTHNISAQLLSNLQIRFSRNYSNTIPYFSTLPNISSELGIPGISSNPLNAGPPALNFTNFGSLTDSVPTLTRNQSQGATESITLLKGLHSMTFGGGYTRPDINSRTDPNGRGTFNFTGVATSALNANGQAQTGTGYDLADFLLGFPQSSSITYSQTDNYFRQNQWSLYAQDEWKVRSNLTLTAGVRYEYFSPYSEKYGHMANLDIAPDYSNVAVVTPNSVGPYSGLFPAGLINPDRNNFSPRLGLAWKLPFKRSTIIRAGYGIYYNGQAYIQFATQLANQPPFAVSNTVNTSTANVLTLANGFLTTTAREITNTIAVDKNYRTPYAGSWNISIQRELGGGFFAEAGYLGTKGTGLAVKTLPNQAPPGSAAALSTANQLGNASGFTYNQAIGNSSFNALQLRLQRRFNRGISMTAYYQFAKSIDDSSTFGGAGNTVAQNWLDLSAERGLSSFDVRHQFQANFVWTSPVGGPGSHLSGDTKIGKLLKDWQLTGAIVAQTGNPLTARVLGNTQQLAQTGGVGSGRAEATGEPIDSGTGFFNLGAFTTAPLGQYGNAGRNTIPGPGTFSLNAAFARSFNLAERRRLEFRLEANNVLNHVNYTNLNTVVNAINYGLPSAASAMRTMQIVVRFRF